MREWSNRTAVNRQVYSSFRQTFASCSGVAGIAESVAGDEEALLSRTSSDVVLGGVMTAGAQSSQGVLAMTKSRVGILERSGVIADNRSKSTSMARLASYACGKCPDNCILVTWGTSLDINLTVGVLTVAYIVMADCTVILSCADVRTGCVREVEIMRTT